MGPRLGTEPAEIAVICIIAIIHENLMTWADVATFAAMVGDGGSLVLTLEQQVTLVMTW